MRFLFLILTLLSTTASAIDAERAQCEAVFKAADNRSKSSGECEENYEKISKDESLLACSQGTYGYQYFIGRLRNCHARAMQAELEKRVSFLELKDRARIPKELELQKKFRRAMKICRNPEIVGEGMVSPAARYECEAEFYAYRFGQALAINEKSLSLKAGRTCAKAKTNEFKDYASALCGVPSTQWDGRPEKSRCPAAVAGDFCTRIKALNRATEN